jgi:hypothetical protein
MNHIIEGKSPDLKFRYAKGLGDIVACSLHSKPIGWLTHFITGNDKPCTTCSIRRNAMNVLFPFPFWRIFFKNQSDLLQNLAAEYRAIGYNVEINQDSNKLLLSKATVREFSR